MSFLLGTSVAKQDFLEAGDMREELCAEFSLPPEGHSQYMSVHSRKIRERELSTLRQTFHHGMPPPKWRILEIEYSKYFEIRFDDVGCVSQL